MRKQAQRFGTEIVNGYVHDGELTGAAVSSVLRRSGSRGEDGHISTGSSAKLIGIESEIQLMGHGVSTCATCDGFFFRGKEDRGGRRRRLGDGRGDIPHEVRHQSVTSSIAATRCALRRSCRTARWRIRRSSSSGTRSSKKWSARKDSGVTGLKLRNVEDAAERPRSDVDGLFIAIGHNPNTEIFKGQIDLDDQGYIKTQPNSTRTNIPGVFACGDVQDPVFRQAITAAGTGCMAAIEAERWLEH